MQFGISSRPLCGEGPPFWRGPSGVSTYPLPPNFHQLSPFSGVGTPIPGISEISLPVLAPFPQAWKFFDLRDPTSPKTVGTQHLHYPNGNPLLPSSSPPRFPWPRSSAYCGPLGFRGPGSVNIPMSRLSFVYFPLCFLFIKSSCVGSAKRRGRAFSLSIPGG